MGEQKKEPNAAKKAATTSQQQPPKKQKKKLSRLEIFFHVAFMVSVIGSMMLAAFIQQPVSWAQQTSGDLLGEELLDTPEAARTYADQAVAEFQRLWAEPRLNWQVMQHPSRSKQALAVECRHVTEGPFNTSLIHLGRAEGIVRGVTAQEAYDFMTSPEGLAMMVPSSHVNARDFETVIEKIPEWRDGQARAEVGEFSIPSFFVFAERTVVVLKS